MICPRVAKLIKLLAGGDVPSAHRTVVTRRNQGLGVIGESHRGERQGVAFERAGEPPGGCIPKVEVNSAHGYAFAVGRKSNGANPRLFAKMLQYFASQSINELDLFRFASNGEALAIW